MRSASIRGAFFMLGAVAIFAVMDALMKVLTQHYQPMQVSALRGAASLPFILAPLLWRGSFAELKPTRPLMHLARGALGVGMMAGFLYGVRELSLADAYAIFLVSPVLVTAFAVPLLGERVGWRRWMAVAVGLSGALYMLKPSGSNLASLGALATFGAAACYALNAIAVRVLTRTETTTSVVFSMMFQLALYSALLALPDWRAIPFEHFGLIIAMGFVGAVAQHLMTEAFRSASPSVVAPFEYTALIWGVAIDWAIWHVYPGARVYIGGSIVVASGLYIIWREHEAASREQ